MIFITSAIISSSHKLKLGLAPKVKATVKVSWKFQLFSIHKAKTSAQECGEWHCRRSGCQTEKVIQTTDVTNDCNKSQSTAKNIVT